jgi:hypothetical protein
MAVAVILDFEGATLDQYDQVVEKMGFSAGGTDNGFRATDVWESREQFERFAEESIGPLSQEVGLTNPPQIEFHEVHNHLSAG